jgi:hypothetical protein
MADRLQSSPAGWQALRQCRCEIEAAWEQVAAGRQILANTRWLLTRWTEQARLAAQPAPVAVPRRSMGGDFVAIESEPTGKPPVPAAESPTHIRG